MTQTTCSTMDLLHTQLPPPPPPQPLPGVITLHMCRPTFTASESVLSLAFFVLYIDFCWFLPMWYIVRCAHLLFSVHLPFLCCYPFPFLHGYRSFSVPLVYLPFQLTLEILPSFCDFSLSFFALIFASPLVLSLQTHKQNDCDLFLYTISKMLSYPSPQIKLVYCFHGSYLLEHLLLASCLALSFNLWIFTGCFSLSH